MALTEKQRKILRGFAAGMTRKQIAADLSITVKGLEWHWAKIGDRFGVRDQFRIALAAKRRGIV